jgi:transcriptional regulator with PAS, ATPase and Fis domain
LIQGESGTGKELVARALHAESLRRNQAFISLNCAAVPESLLESELFGHTRGAFTDAKEARMGLFELAHQGTLFLDEIAEMPLAMQSKLLRVIQERAVRRLGGARETSVDVRILAATNRRLSDLVAEGRFRQDLFFRLNVIPILVPPLRERMGDIPELAREFCHRFARRMNRPVTGISEDAMRALRARPWPGNVRELENALERAVALETEPAIQLQRVHDDGGAGSPAREDLPSVPLPRYLDLEEKRLLLAALGRAAGDRRKAADLLGVSQRALRYLLQKHDTSRPTA